MKRIFSSIVAAVFVVTALVGAGSAASANEDHRLPKIDGCVALNIKADIALKVAQDKVTVLNAQLSNAQAALAKAKAALAAALAAVPKMPATVAAALAAVNGAAADVAKIEAQIVKALDALAKAKVEADVDHCKGEPGGTTTVIIPAPPVTPGVTQVDLPSTPLGVGTGA